MAPSPGMNRCQKRVRLRSRTRLHLARRGHAPPEGPDRKSGVLPPTLVEHTSCVYDNRFAHRARERGRLEIAVTRMIDEVDKPVGTLGQIRDWFVMPNHRVVLANLRTRAA